MSAPQLNDLAARLRVIASVPPFTGWPLPALERLGRSARATAFRRGQTIIVEGQPLDNLVLVFGPAKASVAAADGRRIIFNLARDGAMYGLAPLVDGLPMQHDLVAVAPVVTLSIPHAAVRRELAAAPALWESIARESTTRGRRFFGVMRQFAFDVPRVRVAAVLVTLAQGVDAPAAGPVVIPERLPLERLAEMLGVSRQWATALVRELTEAGVVEWRYGRATVLDLERLSAIAASGINAWSQLADRPPRGARGASRAAGPA